MKRTRRYGGFRIADKVRDKKTLAEGDVTGFTRGYVVVDFPINDRLTQIVSLMPNQLINLTRIEESKRKITDPLPPFPQELAEELNKRCEEYLKIINQDDITKDFNLPNPFKANFNPAKEMREKAEQELCETYGVEFPIKDNPLLNPDPLPSPYTRDVYTSTKDYSLPT